MSHYLSIWHCQCCIHGGGYSTRLPALLWSLHPRYPLTDGKSHEPVSLRSPLGTSQLSLANQLYLCKPRSLASPGAVFMIRTTRAPMGLAQNQAPAPSVPHQRCQLPFRGLYSLIQHKNTHSGVGNTDEKPMRVVRSCSASAAGPAPARGCHRVHLLFFTYFFNLPTCICFITYVF